MFNPALHGLKEDGIHKYLHDCIIKCDNDIRKDLFKNIVLAGGSTMFKGMKERMKILDLSHTTRRSETPSVTLPASKSVSQPPTDPSAPRPAPSEE